MRRRVSVAVVAVAFVVWAINRPARALPTMIRLGYNNCAVCHISPQGGGLLNAYGRGIDEAQSLRGGEYQPSKNRFVKWIDWRDHITQDVRSVTQETVSETANGPVKGNVRSRIMYRNATELGKGFRFSGVVVAENEASMRPNLPYESALSPRAAYVTSVLLSYRPKNTLEFAIGRDQLPSGINIPDLTFDIRAFNRLGYYDSPLQCKAFWWGKRYLISPYAFFPGGPESADDREKGGGSLAEFDLLGKGTTVVGVNALHGSSLSTQRTMVGPYFRLGFGPWGILAEHDITERQASTSPRSFLQHATYAQAFWYPREWLLTSVVGEQLKTGVPFAEHLVGGRLEITSRFNNHVTLGLTARLQRNVITGKRTRAVAIQLALKTVP